jgi:hypothetical protein
VIGERASIIAGAGQRGGVSAAAGVMGTKARSPQRQQALAELNVERGAVQARAANRGERGNAGPRVLGVGAGPERAVRWLIAPPVCCLDAGFGRRVPHMRVD